MFLPSILAIFFIFIGFLDALTFFTLFKNLFYQVFKVFLDCLFVNFDEADLCFMLKQHYCK